MAHSILVKVLNSIENGSEEFEGSHVVDSAVLDDVVKQLPRVGVLHDEVELVLGLDDLV